ncbi:MAG: amino acid permease [Solirubrobacteraceae bacterium]|nr:amino acid permease [Solirubrobacteraceae bacterium]
MSPTTGRQDFGRRALGAPTLFAVVWTSLASAIYFSLGVIAERALGLTPLVFLVSGVFFALTAMTYVEGSSLHQERSGSTVFARYAFNELWSFVAGWAILLDFLILIAVTSLSATNYAAVFWSELGHGATETAVCVAIIGYVAIRNVRGFSATRSKRVGLLVTADLALQGLIVVLGLILFLQPDVLVESIDLGTSPTWSNLIFALTLSTVAFTGLESAAGLSGELRVSRGALRRVITSATGSVLVIYTGIALVAISALPIENGVSPLAKDVDAPVVAVVEEFDPAWLGDALTYVVAALAAITLIAAANSAMLGLSRLAYSLATNRQIPTRLGRLHSTRATPFVVIVIAAVLAILLVLPQDLEFLVGIYAFGALLAFFMAHLSIVVLRYREPNLVRPYRVPWSIPFKGGDLPLPAVLGAGVTASLFIGLVIFHGPARFVGLGWMAAGLVMYVGYRRSRDMPVFARVQVPEAALRHEPLEAEYGSILVPVFGTALDDDIVQTAGRLASEEGDPDEGEGAMIEAVWIFEVPMSLPIDARLPEEQLKLARMALARAKAVGEEYEGVQVATATVRARRVGQAIVDEARRRGVEAIVLAAEEPSRIRGGARLGGRGGALDNFVGEATKYVLQKAPCRVILTAPPAESMPSEGEETPTSDAR